MSDGVWVLTQEYNDYNQHGEYLRCIWQKKPTIEELADYFWLREAKHSNVMGALKFLLHVHNGGGREGTEETWYQLTHIRFGEKIDEPA